MKNKFLTLIIICLVCFSGCKKNVAKTTTTDSTVDIDFSTMNYNIISSQLFNIMIEPEEYSGKTIKFRGNFYSNFEESLNQRFYSVLVYDSTACCQVGFEIQLPDNPEYPSGYPEEMAEIEVYGTLIHEESDGTDRFYILCSELNIL